MIVVENEASCQSLTVYMPICAVAFDSNVVAYRSGSGSAIHLNGRFIRTDSRSNRSGSTTSGESNEVTSSRCGDQAKVLRDASGLANELKIQANSSGRKLDNRIPS